MVNENTDLEMMDSSMLLFLLEIKLNGDWHSTSQRLLGKYGYVANQAQNPEVIAIMKHAFSTIPGILWIVTAIVLFFYRLNKNAITKS